MRDKRCTMAEAIGRWVPDGTSVVMGTALESLIPFAAGHEIIRQRRRDLTLIAPISDMLFDQIIGAGLVRRVIASWVGNVSEGLGHNYRRAMERGEPAPLEVEDHSNYTLGLALWAAAHGTPYVPTRTMLGSDLPRSNPRLRVAPAPAGLPTVGEGTPLLLVPALRPDVAILHVQRADPEGNAHAWGNLGLSQEAGLAAEAVIIVAEEIVAPEVIRSDPNRVLVPGFKVVAVVHEPGGAHPSPVQGYYGRDHAMYAEYHEQTRTPEGYARWLADWVDGVPGRAAYLERLGAARWQALRPREHALAAPVDYGY
ncbi:MAG TPA: CoA-transferase [Chloroflexota bacterium]|nr:CoA-transferase [Chloroflexota bacterium]